MPPKAPSSTPASSPARAKPPRSPGGYDIHPSIAPLKICVDTLADRTGKSFDQWVKLAAAGGPDQKSRKAWLVANHAFAKDAADWIAARSLGRGWDDDPDRYLETADDLVAAMFAGPKTALLPLHAALMKAARRLGSDIRIAPCTTIIPIYRNHVIAQIKPSTRTRIDFGLALKGQKPPKRLIDTGGAAKGDRITHRIEVSQPADIDDTLRTWLQRAYELDA